jgi:hypothetical protein
MTERNRVMSGLVDANRARSIFDETTLDRHVLRIPAHRMSDTAPALGGKWAVLLFIVMLLAFVTETQLTQVRGSLESVPCVRIF